MDKYQKAVTMLIRDMKSRELIGDVMNDPDSMEGFRDMKKEWAIILKKIFKIKGGDENDN